jgi:hypothetical protein
MKNRLLLIGSLMAASSSFAYAAPCTDAFLFTPNGRTDHNGVTRQNMVCTIKYGKVADISGYRLVTPPTHGTVGSAGHQGRRYLTAYKPSDGYIGSDNFVAVINYVSRSSGKHLSTELHIHMTVTP